MAIEQNIGGKLSEMAQSAELSPAPVFDPNAGVEDAGNVMPQPELPFEEFEPQAAFGLGAVRKAITPKKALKPLLEKGARAKEEPKILPDPPPIAPTPSPAAQTTVAPKVDPVKPSIAPVPLD
jgi:hypothetical protein